MIANKVAAPPHNVIAYRVRLRQIPTVGCGLTRLLAHLTEEQEPKKKNGVYSTRFHGLDGVSDAALANAPLISGCLSSHSTKNPLHFPSPYAWLLLTWEYCRHSLESPETRAECRRSSRRPDRERQQEVLRGLPRQRCPRPRRTCRRRRFASHLRGRRRRRWRRLHRTHPHTPLPPSRPAQRPRRCTRRASVPVAPVSFCFCRFGAVRCSSLVVMMMMPCVVHWSFFRRNVCVSTSSPVTIIMMLFPPFSALLPNN